MKISNKISLVILITGISILIILSLAVYRLNRMTSVKTELKHSEIHAKELSYHMNRFLSEKVKMVKMMATSHVIIKALERSNLSYADLPLEKREKLKNRLNAKWCSIKESTDQFVLDYTDNKVAQLLKKKQTTIKNEFGEIFLTNKSGALVASTSKLSTFNHNHKYWWLGSYNNGNGAVFFDDRGYDDSVGGYVLGLAIPIRKEDQIIGILKFNLNIMHSVNELISKMHYDLHAKFKLIRSGGLVMFEEGAEPLSTRVHNTIFQKIKSGASEAFVFTDNDREYLIGLSEIELTKNNGKGYAFGGTFESMDHKKGNTGESWYILHYTPMSSTLSPVIKSVRSICFIGALLIAFLGLVTFWFSKKITRPIEALNLATKQIAIGNFDYQIPKQQKDEFGELALSFNLMSNRLRETTTTIKTLGNEINQRKIVEKELNLSNRRYQNLFTYSPVPLWEEDFTELYRYIEELRIKNVKNFREYIETNSSFLKKCSQKIKILDVNQEALKLIGAKNKEELLGNLDKILADEFFEIFKKEVIALSEGMLEFETEGEIRTLSGDKKSISLKLSIDNGQDEFYRALVATIDITDKKQMGERLIQSQKMESIGTLAGGIAHDFNNILFPILGHTEMLLDDVPEGSSFREGLNEIRVGALRAKDLVKQILTFSRQEMSELKLLKIQQIIKETLKFIRATIPTTISIKEDIQADCGVIRADSTQIHQVVMNLATNAAHAMEDTGGELTIRLKEIELGETDLINSDITPGNYACLKITDTGKGMDKNLTKKIFDPFFTTKKQGKGTGMGLSVVHGIVTRMEGAIDLCSEPGKGTEFTVYVPIEKSSSELHITQANKSIQGGNEQILLVDDEQSIIKMEEQMLERLGYRVISHTSSIDALESFRVNPAKFDLVITDMAMPNLSGDKLAVELVKIRPDIPILLCTGFSENTPHENVASLSIKGFLMKPIAMKDLAQKVREVLDEKRS